MRNFGSMTAVAICAALASPALAQDKTITGAFDVGPGGFPKGFNPLAVTSGFMWLKTYYEPLVVYDAGLSELQGALATEVAISEDRRTYTFTLAEETWHDGEAFTSADVKFTFDLARNPAAASVFAGRLSAIESVETPDDRTAVFTLSQPDAQLLTIIGQVMILPEHALSQVAPESIATSDWWSTAPVGTGPFKFSQYVTDQYVELVADEDYRGGRPKVDRLINRYFENAAAAVSALRAGEIQFTYVEPDDARSFEGNDAFRVIEGPSWVVNYIGFNNELDLWKDVRVRQAVMHAIDRETIVTALYGGAAEVANCGYTAEALVPDGIDPYAYDPERAKALLDEAGWEEINGAAPIQWLTYYGTPQAANVMAAIQAMLAQVGINVVPRALDTPTYNSITYKVDGADPAQFALNYGGLTFGPNPAQLNVALNSSQIPPAGQNIMRVRSEALDGAFAAALGETEDAQANTRWQEVCRVMNAELPWATMWVANRYGVVSSDLVDFVWTPAPGGGPYADHPELWDIR